MAFKSMVQYNEERYGNLFTLSNDGNFADVVFLYQSKNDVLMADVHYIKSAEYSGYVHCCRVGCPACARNIRVQNKLFIPLYNITDHKIQFFDRSTKFAAQLANDVFDKFPNPSEYVFRITRHGVAGDINTIYQITAVGTNTSMPYAKILADNNATMPDYYSNVVREVSVADLSGMLNSGESSAAVPREAYVPAPSMTIPVPQLATNAFNEPTNVPEFTDELKLPEAFTPESTSADAAVDVDNVDF